MTVKVNMTPEERNEVPGGSVGPAMGQPARLQLALAEHLETLYRLIWYVADEDVGEDELVACIATLAHDESEIVPPGRERAWLLRTLLSLLGASVVAETEHGGDLPKLARMPAAGSIDIPDAAIVRLHQALQAVDKPERASVVLVVQEGLSVAEAARIQGGSRTEFQRRLADGMAALGDDLIETLMGGTGRAARS